MDTSPLRIGYCLPLSGALPDPHFVVYMNTKDPTPPQELHSREALAPVSAALNQRREWLVDTPSLRSLVVVRRSPCLNKETQLRGGAF